MMVKMIGGREKRRPSSIQRRLLARLLAAMKRKRWRRVISSTPGRILLSISRGSPGSLSPRA